MAYTTETFIEKAKQIHNNDYDYSLVEYTGCNNEIQIKCNTCGNIFLQKPYIHLDNHGCSYCYGKKKKTTEQFVEEAKQVHGNKYDYSLVEYVNNSTKVQIKCNICGNIFWQEPIMHANRKQGCPFCANNIVKTTEQFIEEAKQIHNNDYDYSLVEYVNNGTKVQIKCNICGNIFWQSPSVHLGNHGCPKCAIDKKINFDIIKEYENIQSVKEYKKEYLKIIKTNKDYKEKGEIHHILPKSMFPLWKDRESNLVKLSFQDHYKAHYLLWKIYDNYEMASAFKLMNNILKNNSFSKEIKLGKRIYCFEQDKTYNSIAEAEKDNKLKAGSRITEALKDWTKTSAGFHWCLTENKEEAVSFWNKEKK